MNNIVFVADMDGTLTPARLPMTENFMRFFEKFIKSHLFYIVSGSDYKKICEQVPAYIVEQVSGVYASMGSELYEQGRLIYQYSFEPEQDLLDLLEKYRKNTKYNGTLYPNYIEKRCGMVNFSVLGRDCPYEERVAYTNWDNIYNERKSIRQELINLYPQYDISLGGNISIDIVPKGKGKEQIAEKLRQHYPDEKIIFIGDRTMEGGNDYSLAQALLKLGNSEVVQVNGPDDTLDYLGKYE